MDPYDKLIKESIDGHVNDIPCPPAEEMFAKITQKLNEETTQTTAAPFKFKKQVAAAIVVLILGSSLLLTTGQASAVKQRILSLMITHSSIDSKSTSQENGNVNTPPPPDAGSVVSITLDNFEEAQKLTAYQLLCPQYIPEGYVLKKIELTGDREQYYKFKMTYGYNDKMIIFEQHYREEESAKGVSFSEGDTTLEEVDIHNTKGNLVVFNKNGSSLLIWQDHYFDYSIMCDAGREEVIKMAKALS